ncbi:MAG: hypothetical protein WC606_04890 [Candidatus Absconditabacterales bacterium]
MKKIISILLLVLFLSGNFSFGQAFNLCGTEPSSIATQAAIDDYNNCINQQSTNTTTTTNQGQCPGSPGCPGYQETMNDINNQSTTDTSSSTSVMGIDCDQTKLVNGQCKLNIYDTLGIRKSVKNEGDPTSVGLFVQDVILSATFFIGTLVTVALIVSGLMFIFAASSGKDPANAKKGIIGSLVGLLIVVSSYVIIRLVQYIAKGF